ncbi:MAG: Hpt domain-containing protein [Polyangiaceae bacterium]
MADDRAREDFFSEAQEIIEGYARDLLALEDGQLRGDVDPDLINDVFRAVHTLKGLAGLFNAARMGTVTHNLEELLDDLRLGRRPLERTLLDLLFRSVDVCGALLLAERQNDRAPTPEADVFLSDLAAFLKGQVGASSAPVHGYELDAEPRSACSLNTKSTGFKRIFRMGFCSFE